MAVARPTLKEKMLLEHHGYDSRYFLKLDEDAECYTFLEFVTGKQLVIPKEKS